MAEAPTTERVTNATVRRVDPARESGWDEAIAKHPHGSFFHSAAWASVLESTYGFRPLYFTVGEPSALRLLAPLMEVDSPVTGRRGVSLPFTDDCEPISPDEASFKEVVQEAIGFGRERKWKYVEFRGGRKLMGDVPASVSFHGHELDLAGDEEQLFGRVESSVRRAIRKAEKEGVKVEVLDTLDSVRIFYSLLCRTRKKHGMPPQPFKFFRNIHQHVIARNLGVVILARHEGRPIAANMYFRFGTNAIYKFGASDERFQNLRGSNLVMWEAIKWHARQGIKRLHLGRTSLGNDGLRRFKLGWGASEQPIEYVKFDLRNDRFVTDSDQSSGWHNKFFNAAPIFVSKFIGAALYRHWA